jgi:hypothetical protein
MTASNQDGGGAGAEDQRYLHEFLPGVVSDNDSLAQQYARRDAELRPTQTVSQWRDNLDALLNAGPPYGKTFCPAGCPAGHFAAWRTYVSALPKSATPVEVYGTAPEAALVWLGY